MPVTLSILLAVTATSQAETQPLRIEGIDWENRLSLTNQFIDQHQTRDSASVDIHNVGGTQTVAIITDEEIIIINCSRREALFEMKATPF